MDLRVFKFLKERLEHMQRVLGVVDPVQGVVECPAVDDENVADLAWGEFAVPVLHFLK